MTDSPVDRVGRSERAAAAMAEFVGPAFDELRSDYLEALADAASKTLDDNLRSNIEKMALAIKVLDTVRASLTAIVADGQVAQHGISASEQLRRLRPEQQRFARY